MTGSNLHCGAMVFASPSRLAPRHTYEPTQYCYAHQDQPWTKKRAAKAIREIYQLSRAASASVSQATDAVINDLREARSVNRFPRVDKGQTINPQDAGTAWGVTRKSPKHGMIFALTLPRLKSLIRPQALASEVIDEMAKRTILHKDPDGNAARELMNSWFAWLQASSVRRSQP